ncbi:hypothetical protein BJY01DRAFT_214397 [Aspergillus pseudoustus]|uniref:Uncharacterized protein n=1 Tax=Aspergillus pseudoustus TaxID=1810923 RepID=A0ABR4JZ04_9EURO
MEVIACPKFRVISHSPILFFIGTTCLKHKLGKTQNHLILLSFLKVCLLSTLCEINASFFIISCFPVGFSSHVFFLHLRREPNPNYDLSKYILSCSCRRDHMQVIPNPFKTWLGANSTVWLAKDTSRCLHKPFTTIHPAPVTLWELLQIAFCSDELDTGSSTYPRVEGIAQLLRLLAPPPLQLLESADQGICSKLFSSHGEFKLPGLIQSEEFNLSTLTPLVHGEDEKAFP